MLFFYIYYISIFGGVGGVVNLYCTLLTRKKVEWKCFRLSLKYIPILKFSLDKGNKVRKQKIRGRARPCKLNRMAFLPNKMEASSVSFSSTSTTNSKFKLVFIIYLIPKATVNVASMREPLDGSLWWYWIAANAAKKNGASFKNYHRLSHLFYLCGVRIRQSLLCNMRDWSQG